MVGLSQTTGTCCIPWASTTFFSSGNALGESVCKIHNDLIPWLFVAEIDFQWVTPPFATVSDNRNCRCIFNSIASIPLIISYFACFLQLMNHSTPVTSAAWIWQMTNLFEPYLLVGDRNRQSNSSYAASPATPKHFGYKATSLLQHRKGKSVDLSQLDAGYPKVHRQLLV